MRFSKLAAPRLLPLCTIASLGLACGPIGPFPGGALSGEVHHERVADWSFSDDAHTIQLETDSQDPRSVNTWCVGYQGNLYIPTSLIMGTENPAERGWVQNVLRDPLVRVRIDGTVYELRAERVDDPTELEAVRAKFIAKYDEVEAGEEQAENAWIFRLVSRDAPLAATPTAPSASATVARATEVPIGFLPGIGDLHHPIRTSSPEAQRYFDQGLTLGFGFNHEAAIRSFREATRRDPNCAICYWGIALAFGPNINMPMGPDDEAQALEAIDQALEKLDAASEAERALIEALATRYGSSPPADRGHRDSAYAEAMRDVHERYPEDLDVAVLFAESLMMLHAWDYWTPDREPREHTLELVETLEGVLAVQPNHLGANHFYIHAVEDPYPERAESAADRLAAAAPENTGHLIHMPSHIFWRVGRYAEASEINQRAAAADEDYFSWCQSQGIYDADYYPHNLHFLWAAASTEGRSDLAITSARRLAIAITPEKLERFPHVEAYLPTPMFALARFGRWDEILGLPEPELGGEYTRGIWHYVRGLALLRSGDAKAAQVELELVAQAAGSEAMEQLGFVVSPAATLLRLGELHLRGELEASRGSYDAAVASLEEAVALQDALPYTEPPPWYFPSRLALGALLLAADRPAEAAAVYRADLEQYPRNGWALFGLSESLEAQGKQAEAQMVSKGFRNAWQSADVELVASRF